MHGEELSDKNPSGLVVCDAQRELFFLSTMEVSSIRSGSVRCIGADGLVHTATSLKGSLYEII